MNYTKFDAAEFLDSDDAVAAYVSAVLEEGDPDLLLAALGDVARARGMTKLAAASGLNRESLYKALRPGAKPYFDTVFRIMKALNIQIQARAMPQN